MAPRLKSVHFVHHSSHKDSSDDEKRNKNSIYDEDSSDEEERKPCNKAKPCSSCVKSGSACGYFSMFYSNTHLYVGALQHIRPRSLRPGSCLRSLFSLTGSFKAKKNCLNDLYRRNAVISRYMPRSKETLTEAEILELSFSSQDRWLSRFQFQTYASKCFRSYILE